MKKKLQLFSGDANFVKLFAIEKQRLTSVLGPDVVIEHIGSTSVPALGGKGIIDIAVGVPNKIGLQQTAKILRGVGYFLDLDHDRPNDRIFLASREHDSTLGDYHLHIIVKGSDEWNQLLLFRDLLRADRSLADEYMILKNKLFDETSADRRQYAEMKSYFIQKTLKGQYGRDA